jgi:hypothetical protein
MVVDLYNLSLDTVRKVEPVFNLFYEKVIAKEAVYLAFLIREGQDSGEFIKTDVDKIATSILTVITSIRCKEIHTSHINLTGEASYNKILEEIKFISKLILKGIRAI